MHNAIMGICSKHRFVSRRNFSFFLTRSSTFVTRRACNWDLTLMNTCARYSMRLLSMIFSRDLPFLDVAVDIVECISINVSMTNDDTRTMNNGNRTTIRILFVVHLSSLSIGCLVSMTFQRNIRR
jgi:hypothetical protein